MPTATIRRKITKGRVVRTPDGFEVGQSVHFAAVTPRTWIMTLEPHEEAERLAAALPGPRSNVDHDPRASRRRPSVWPPRFLALPNRPGMRLWPAFKASRTPPVDGLEQSERLSWIQQPLMLRHWPLPRSSRRSAGRGAGVAWFDDSAL